MGRYDNQKCDCCGEKLKQGEDIVVCPLCGTPQHRSCWDKYKSCANAQKHAENFSWTPDEQVSSESGENFSSGGAKKLDRKCPHCNEDISEDTLFCPNCSQPIIAQQSFQPNGGQNFNPFLGMPYFNPYGGVSPDENIEGIKASEIAEFVQSNTQYYIPKFKQMSKKKNKFFSWNWAPFFLGYLWFFFRKSYFWGAILGILELGFSLLTAPYLNEYFDVYYQFLDNQSSQQLFDALQAQLGPMLVISGITLVIKIICAVIANGVYYNGSIKTIKNIKEETDSKEECTQTLRKIGGISLFTMTASYIVFYMFSSVFQFFLK